MLEQVFNFDKFWGLWMKALNGSQEDRQELLSYLPVVVTELRRQRRDDIEARQEHAERWLQVQRLQKELAATLLAGGRIFEAITQHQQSMRHRADPADEALWALLERAPGKAAPAGLRDGGPHAGWPDVIGEGLTRFERMHQAQQGVRATSPLDDVRAVDADSLHRLLNDAMPFALGLDTVLAYLRRAGHPVPEEEAVAAEGDPTWFLRRIIFETARAESRSTLSVLATLLACNHGRPV